MIRNTLEFIAANFLAAKNQEFTGHPVANFLRKDAPREIAEALANRTYLVDGSPGQGQWADIPWIAIFDRTVTTSATRGYYPVYLFTADMKEVVLALGQGTTAIREEFGRGRHQELRRLADLMRARLPDAPPRFSSKSVALGGASGLAEDYEPSIALSITYDLASLPEEEVLHHDLQQMVRLYSILIARGGREIFEDASPGGDDPDSGTIEERRRYRQHLRIERAPGAGRMAKKVHGYACQACGLDFEKVYGPFGKEFIEAHHLTPLSALPQDVPVSLDPKTDFAVLCANCHRMIHRKEGPTTIGELRALVGIVELRKLIEDLYKTMSA